MNYCKIQHSSRLIPVVLFTLAFSHFVFPALSAQPPRPNIIFILADDLGPDDVGVYGAFDYEAVALPPGEDPATWVDAWGRPARDSLTPRIDQLAEQGLRFKTAHATAICSPSRIQYLTGQYPWRNGTIDIDGSRYFNDPNGPNHIQLLKDSGYYTGGAGKSAKNNDPFLDENLFLTFANYWPNNNADIGVAPYGGDLVQDFALDFIERHHPQAENGFKPFYFYYSLLHPHTPILPTPDSLEFNGGAPPGETLAETTFRHYVDNIRYIDKVVGEIVDKLDDLGQLDNTLIIYTGDNGSSGKSNGAIIQSPIWDSASGSYRRIDGSKADRNQNREGTSLVPFIVHWPNVITGPRVGSVVEDLVDFTDLFPTFAEVAGATIPANWEIHGQSFLPILSGDPYLPREWVYTQIQNNWAIRGPKYRLNRDGRFFDMSDAPFSMAEITNLTPAQTAIRDEYQAVLDAFDPVKGPTYESHQDKKWGNPAWDWKVDNFSATERWETPTSGDLADPDGDGVPNIFERLWKRDPLNGTDTMPVIAFDGSRLSISVPGVTGNGTQLTVEESDDLIIWNPVASPSIGAPFEFSGPLHPDRNFMRLRAERITPWDEP